MGQESGVGRCTAIEIARIVPFGPGFPTPSPAELIQAFESCRLESYQDQKGIWTIGWGCTGVAIRQGLHWTQAQADAEFATRLEALESQLDELIHAPLSPGQRAALASFCWNIGIGAFRTSWMLTLVNQHSWMAAARELLRWDHVGPGEARGLLHRRLAEALVMVNDSVGA